MRITVRCLFAFFVALSTTLHAGPRVGTIDINTGFSVKDGPLTSAWVFESGGITQASMTSTRIGVLNGGILSVKEGDLYAPWVQESGDVSQFALTGNRIVVLSTNGMLSAKEGDLYAPWVQLTGGVSQFSVSDNRMVILTTDNRLVAKQGSLFSGWITLHHAMPPVTQVIASGLRVGYRTTAGDFCLLEGLLFEGPQPPIPPQPCLPGWTHISGAVAQIAMSDLRIAVLGTNGILQIKDGKKDATWVTVNRATSAAVSQIVLSGTRVGYRSVDGFFFAFDGPLVSNPAWLQMTGSSVQISMSEFSPAFVSGTEQIVDPWVQCPGSSGTDVPDTPARAFRDSIGLVQMIAGSSGALIGQQGMPVGGNRRLVGSTLGSVAKNCNVVLASAFDNIYAHRQDQEFIHGLYTLDGNTIYALIHNEFHPDTHDGAGGDMCDIGSGPDDDKDCVKVTIGLATSTNRGATYSHSLAPDVGGPVPNADHSIAWLPFSYAQLKQGFLLGLASPSNIILANDGYFYATISAGNREHGDDEELIPAQSPGICLIRNQNLADVHSWRAFGGQPDPNTPPDPHGFNTRFYKQDMVTGSTCQVIGSDVIPPGVLPTHLAFSTYYNQYIMVGYHDAVYFWLATDEHLRTWSAPRKIEGLVWPPNTPTAPFNAYAAIFDHTDASRNFERPGQHVFLYYTHFKAGANSTDRDLRRIGVTFRK